MTFRDLIVLYVRHLQSLRRHPSTLRNHRCVTSEFARFCQDQLGLTEPRQLQPQHFRAFLAVLAYSPLTPLVRYSRQRLLRTWLAWATYRGYLLTDPSQGLTTKHPPQLPRGAPSVSQVMKMLAAPDASWLGQRDRMLLEFLYGTGVRIGECLAIDVDDLHLDQRQVLIRHGKNGTSRVLPLATHLLNQLRHYLAEVRPRLSGADSPALWLSRKGRLTVLAANARIRNWAQLADVPITAHSLRHAFATHLLARGASLVSIQRLLGHTTMKMTCRYTHLVPTDVQHAVTQHHPRGKKKRHRRARTQG